MGNKNNLMNNLNYASIEKIKANDIKQVLKISEECHLAFWSELDYQNEIERDKSLVLGAKVERNLIGFIATRFNFSESIANDADILNIGVLEKHQNSGIGNLLLGEFLLKA